MRSSPAASVSIPPEKERAFTSHTKNKGKEMNC
jgi:hypothetical protein